MSSCYLSLYIMYPSNIFLTCLELFLIFLRRDRNFGSQLSLANPQCAATTDRDKPYREKSLENKPQQSKAFRGYIQDIHNDQTSLKISYYNTHVKGNHVKQHFLDWLQFGCSVFLTWTRCRVKIFA